ncbi:4-diphosphocytidyl-2-C-methyl-D-erythritol kinase [Spirochaetia bacterium]|nr:4-diphosphocytidyl-2-C-methyl-D-erythritol kinase [Spirochaetia bacterium]
MPNVIIEAPAKLNLHLGVKNRRPDGFHDIESIFIALGFGDTLYFETPGTDSFGIPSFGTHSFGMAGIYISIEDGDTSALPSALPIEKNIIFKAISLFRDRTGYTQGLRVRVEKRIPLGGGLGGGSSNAASTLLALNTLCAAEGKTPLDAASLAELAASLGSDVPFFLGKTGAAWVSGRGERIKPLEAPKTLSFVLVNPGFPSETAIAFRLLDEFRENNHEGICLGRESPRDSGFPHEQLIGEPGDLLRFLCESPRNWPFENDFLPAFLADSGNTGAAGAYREMLGRLRDLGADFAGLSGSGATCFGVFTEREQAEKAQKALLKAFQFVKVTFPLARRAKAVLK